MLNWIVNKPANSVKKLKIPSIFNIELPFLLKALLINITDTRVPNVNPDDSKNFKNVIKNVFLNVFLVLNNFPKKMLLAKKIDIDTIDPNKNPVKYV